MRHSGYTYYRYYAVMDGWTFDDGATFYGHRDSGVDNWEYESGVDHYDYDLFYGCYFNPGCLGDIQTSGWAHINYSGFGWGGAVGTGEWSQFRNQDGANILGATDCAFMLVMTGGYFYNYYTRRGHEIYELLIWYDP